MSNPSDDVVAGQRVYTRSVLRLYDWWVLGISNSLIWRCPSRELLAMYQRLTSANHLEIGVGTGYFLDRCQVAFRYERLGLADLNEQCLQYAAHRIRRHSPQVWRTDVLDSHDCSPERLGRYDSISLNYVVHCLPGSLAEKQIAFENAHNLLNPGGVMFGSTIVGAERPPNVMAKLLMNFYNRTRVFSNRGDDLASLQAILSRHFATAQCHLRGNVALFQAERAS